MNETIKYVRGLKNQFDIYYEESKHTAKSQASFSNIEWGEEKNVIFTVCKKQLFPYFFFSETEEYVWFRCL